MPLRPTDPPDPSAVPTLWLPWGKWGAADSPGYHPLICHMLDVAVVARRLWELHLGPAGRDALCRDFGLQPRAAHAWLAFLTALHDLGKLSPTFQLQVTDLRVMELLRRAGLACRAVPKIPHGHVTAHALPPLLQHDFGIDPVVAKRLGVLLGGHHGTFPSNDELQEIRRKAGDDRWGEARRSLVRALADLLGVLPEDRPFACPNPGAMTFAGLVSVADWVGSNVDYFPFAIREMTELDHGSLSLAAYLEIAERQADEALAALGWRQLPPPAARQFEDIFGFAPNPLQQAAAALATEIDGPGFAVIEAPMGEGKTEAALYLGDRWMVSAGLRGCYFALPTQATSNQLFGRIKRFLTERYPGDEVQLQLLHGHASLNAEFELLFDRPGGTELFSPSGVDVDGDASDGHGCSVFAAEWFSHRKRGLLSPFGVGTLDQSLMAILRTKHAFVRLFGLSHKLVVVDEVHAYDTYMSVLLERLIEWLSALGTSVILLSATLPANRRRSLLQAYAGTEMAVPNAAYPRLTWIVGGRAGSRSFAVSERSVRDVFLEWHDGTAMADESYPLGEQLQTALAGGGCAAVICNTVQRAQEMYQALLPFFPAQASDGHPELDLLHARFPFGMRQEREERVLERFRKPSEDGTSPHRPHRAVLVATQIIEQSLDLDFDLMISDLAPIDLLLQRTGRLHRHRRSRPEGLDRQTLWILAPESLDESGPRFLPAHEAVYAPHVLLRTWLALQGWTRVSLPGDVEGLIAKVYDDELPDCSPGLRARLEASARKLEEDRLKQSRQAGEPSIPPPGYEGELWRMLEGHRHEDAPNLHPAHQALTRLADPSVSVICLHERSDGFFLPDGSEVDLRQPPPHHLLRTLMMASLTLGKQGLVQALLEEPGPPGWRRLALLRNHRVLRFNSDGICHFRKWILGLDPQLGIRYLPTKGAS